MALNATTLKTALGPEIESKIRTALGLGVVPYPNLTLFSNSLAEAIATKVVDHIQSNASLKNVAGVISGPVTTGTATITVGPGNTLTGGID